MWFAFFCFPGRAGPGPLLACVVVPFRACPAVCYLFIYCYSVFVVSSPFPCWGLPAFVFPPSAGLSPCGAAICAVVLPCFRSPSSPYSSFFCLLVSSAPWHGRCKVFARFSVLAFSACSLSCFACLPFDSRGNCYSCGVLCVTLACSFFFRSSFLLDRCHAPCLRLPLLCFGSQRGDIGCMSPIPALLRHQYSYPNCTTLSPVRSRSRQLP